MKYKIIQTIIQRDGSTVQLTITCKQFGLKSQIIPDNWGRKAEGRTSSLQFTKQ